jgi:hypothetical protein
MTLAIITAVTTAGMPATQDLEGTVAQGVLAVVTNSVESTVFHNLN